jgi:hypothetical protein
MIYFSLRHYASASNITPSDTAMRVFPCLHPQLGLIYSGKHGETWACGVDLLCSENGYRIEGHDLAFWTDAAKSAQLLCDKLNNQETGIRSPIWVQVQFLTTAFKLDVILTQNSLDVTPTQYSLDVILAHHSLDVRPTQHSLDDRPNQRSLDARPTQHSLDDRPTQHSLDVRPS